MSKLELLLQGWDSSYEKEDWYPPLTDVLNGVTVEHALWKPAGEHVNSIWETVNHLVFYKERLLNRLTGEESKYPSGVTNDDTFAISSSTAEEWEHTLAKLKEVHLGLRDKLSAMNEEQLERKIPQTPIGNWIHSLILHDAYHTGQIVFLRKLQGSWPSRRSFE
ncbi:DinB family protein [Cohnella luojiensis]|uniref:DinB family protein n=1 Tax=Cohnella luojiensis TaxID=652876 RepID=A0A4Y8LR05_9BACL|nr:DinB family protein [Cohnella luojiensis]TFE19653.1 DinB family protein [Cohnella luojiensis]